MIIVDVCVDRSRGIDISMKLIIHLSETFLVPNRLVFAREFLRF